MVFKRRFQGRNHRLALCISVSTIANALYRKGLTIIPYRMVMHVYLLYLQWHEVRTDVALARISDPFHPHLTAIDFSIPLFILAYGSLVLGAIHAANKPNLAIELIQKLSLVYLLRMFSLYIAPFEAPKGAIILRDPLAPGNAKPLERDLFFSGHTATTCIVFFTCRAGHLRWKIFFFIIAILTAFMVIVQKTHYVMDVWTAPFVVYGCHRMIIIIRSYFNAVYRYPLFKTKIED